ncbi:hypothetical protein E8A74_21870 [Polyangium fumosum]|uniref:Uncharacterized protein n=1 Tax=Polyangium fumosum TaxID=889272 RepID=A0A4U1J9T9_9BACT|nr:hypothetical protein E8A74_21870 [Polyangium fumosum]
MRSSQAARGAVSIASSHVATLQDHRGSRRHQPHRARLLERAHPRYRQGARSRALPGGPAPRRHRGRIPPRAARPARALDRGDVRGRSRAHARARGRRRPARACRGAP